MYCSLIRTLLYDEFQPPWCIYTMELDVSKNVAEESQLFEKAIKGVCER